MFEISRIYAVFQLLPVLWVILSCIIVHYRFCACKCFQLVQCMFFGMFFGESFQLSASEHSLDVRSSKSDTIRLI